MEAKKVLMDYIKLSKYFQPNLATDYYNLCNFTRTEPQDNEVTMPTYELTCVSNSKSSLDDSVRSI